MRQSSNVIILFLYINRKGFFWALSQSSILDLSRSHSLYPRTMLKVCANCLIDDVLPPQMNFANEWITSKSGLSTIPANTRTYSNNVLVFFVAKSVHVTFTTWLQHGHDNTTHGHREPSPPWAHITWLQLERSPLWLISRSNFTRVYPRLPKHHFPGSRLTSELSRTHTHRTIYFHGEFVEHFSCNALPMSTPFAAQGCWVFKGMISIQETSIMRLINNSLISLVMTY